MDISTKINMPPPSPNHTTATNSSENTMARSINKGALTNSSLKFKNNVKETPPKNASKGVTSPSQNFSVTALTSLLFNESDGRDAKRRQVKWGNDLLDQLEALRIQLISGGISREHLSALSEMLQNKQGFIVDPELENIIREIETRVAVELAKLGFA